MHFMSPRQCLMFTLNDLTQQQLSGKYFVQTPKTRPEKGTRPSARLFFCPLQVIHLLTYIYILHLFRPFKWGFCLHAHNSDFASCLTSSHEKSLKKFITKDLIRVCQQRIYSLSQPRQLYAQIVPPPAWRAIGYIAFHIPP